MVTLAEQTWDRSEFDRIERQNRVPLTLHVWQDEEAGFWWGQVVNREYNNRYGDISTVEFTGRAATRDRAESMVRAAAASWIVRYP